MNLVLPEVLTNFIISCGGIVYPGEDAALEYLAPLDLTRRLGIPESGRLVFTRPLGRESDIYASYDSDLTRTIHDFLSQHGAVASAASAETMVNIEKCQNQILRTVSFSNAVFRLGASEKHNVLYHLIFLKYTAVSDDRQEGIICVLLNTMNSTISFVHEDILPSILSQLRESTEEYSLSWPETEKNLRLAHRAAMAILQRKTKDFVKSLEKRLNRDLQRINDYYAQLTREAEKMPAKLKAQDDIKKEQMERWQKKSAAIEKEKIWKTQDMMSKYTLTLSAQPFLLIRVTVPSVIFWMNIQRRMESRALALTYNPWLKQLDALACEECFNPQTDMAVCDTHLHIVCAECFPVCAVCARKYCKACFPKGCPKCQKVFSTV